MSHQTLNSSHPLVTSLLKIWWGRETSGNFEDLSGNGNTGVVTGGSYVSFGGFDCVQIDTAAGGRITAAHDASFDVPNGTDFSLLLKCHINENNSTWNEVISKGYWPGFKWDFAGWNQSSLFYCRDSSNVGSASGDNVFTTADTLGLMNFTFDASENILTLYFNGVQVGQSTISSSVSTSNTVDLILGNAGEFVLTVARLGLWHQLLTPAEVDSFNTDVDQMVDAGGGSGPEALTGQAGAYAYAGGDAELVAHRNLTVQPGAYAYTGEDASLIAHRLLTGNAGPYAYQGGPADLLRHLLLTGFAGASSYGGGDADLVAHRVLNGQAGSYGYGGGQAALALHRLLQCNAGVYEYEGGQAQLIKHYVLVAEAGAYSYDAGDAILTIVSGNTLVGLPGAYNYAGGQANLVLHRKLNGEAGEYSYTAGVAELVKHYRLTGQAGSYVISGGDADLIMHRLLQGQPGSYEYQGGDVTLTISANKVTVTIAKDAPIVQTISAGSPILTSIEDEAVILTILENEALL